MSFNDHCTFTHLVIGNQVELILNIIKWFSNILFFTHEIHKFLFSMNSLFKDNNLFSFSHPFILCHFLKPIQSKYLDQLRFTFMKSISFCEQVTLHTFKLERLEKTCAKDIREVFPIIIKKDSVEWSKTLTLTCEVHNCFKQLHYCPIY